MPRSVRNFWLSTRIDGRQTRIEAGPQSASSGFTQVVHMRGEGGTVQTAVRITGEALSDGELRLYVTPGEAPDGFFEWPDSMTIEPYKLDGGGFGFRITSKR